MDRWLFTLENGLFITSPIWLPLGAYLFVKVGKHFQRSAIAVAWKIKRK